MRAISFSIRTAKEILRDPLTLAFGLGFPLVLLGLMTAIQANIPVSLFEIESLTPGITVFGLSFMTLFAGTLVAKDRESAFLQRLYTTPMRAIDYIAGYILPMLPIALAQSGACYLAAICLGLTPTVGIVYALLFILPVALLFISLGVAIGSVLNVKAASGICGALVTNLTGWLSGVWFDLSLVGGVFEGIANLLPFVHAVEIERALLGGTLAGMLPHILWTAGYTLLLVVLSIVLFLRQMKKQ